MKATELMRSWSDNPVDREGAILEAVKAGYYQPIEWQPLTVNRHGHTGKVWIARDALRLGEPGDLVRVNVSARLAQRIADLFGAYLPTTFLLDEVARQCLSVVPPRIQPPDQVSRLKVGLSPSMADVGAMRTHSLAVDASLTKLGSSPHILCNTGKHWVITNRLFGTRGKAANYGWYSRSAPYVSASGMHLWQPLGTAHNDQHADYSQVLQLVRDTMEADGAVRSFMSTAMHPELWPLVSDEGPMKLVRIPSVPPADPIPTPASATANFPPEEAETIENGLEDLVSLVLEAKHYTKVDRSDQVSLVVLHTAECAETLSSAEALARWCAGSAAPRASWHFAVDADSITQSVRQEFVAWHAPGANHNGIGIELVGRAAQSAEQWMDPFSLAVLKRAARLVAHLCHRWNLPVEFVDAAGLVAGKRGITTHAEVTKAFKKSTHTDPGKNFPMGRFLEMVQERGEPWT